jgi:hypothetical protein
MKVVGILFTIAVIVLIYIVFRHFFKDVNTLSGLVSGETMTKIDSTSLATSSTGSSNNFTYSIWFFINDWNYRYGEAKVIYGRMGNVSSSGSIDGVSGLDPCPAVVLGAIENNLSIAVGCYPGANEVPTTPSGKSVVHTCSVANVPIQKWVNLLISVYGRTLDVYIDGKLVRTCLLPGVAMVNTNSNIFVTPAGGFNGWTSKFQYWPNSFNPQQAWNIYTQGYRSNALSSDYEIQVSLVENGTTQNTITI